MASELRETIPTFEANRRGGRCQPLQLVGADKRTSPRAGAKALVILLVAVLVIGGLEAWVRIQDVPAYTSPRRAQSGIALEQLPAALLGSPRRDMKVMFIGYAIGAAIGIVLAAVITQFPFFEKIITPYILLLVTTPMIAFVPLLIQKMGFGMEPRIIAVALASDRW